MKKYLVAFASVLAFSAPAMASEQAIEFMSDTQLGQHSGARIVVADDRSAEGLGVGYSTRSASDVWDMINTLGNGVVYINGKRTNVRDADDLNIKVRVAKLRAQLFAMSAQRFKKHVLTVDADKVYHINTK